MTLYECLAGNLKPHIKKQHKTSLLLAEDNQSRGGVFCCDGYLLSGRRRWPLLPMQRSPWSPRYRERKAGERASQGRADILALSPHVNWHLNYSCVVPPQPAVITVVTFVVRFKLSPARGWDNTACSIRLFNTHTGNDTGMIWTIVSCPLPYYCCSL